MPRSCSSLVTMAERKACISGRRSASLRRHSRARILGNAVVTLLTVSLYLSLINTHNVEAMTAYPLPFIERQPRDGVTVPPIQ
jgi:hypothetical protein